MNNEKQIIKNAIDTCKRERYNQVVYVEDGYISFSRDYPNNNMYKKENVIGKVIGIWEKGCYIVKYIKNKGH